ncbi:maleylpyruvate isomerase N-terminal domain-containing protein [Streptomyces sp. NPDC002215]
MRAVRAEQWTAPTPCAEWDVRHLGSPEQVETAIRTRWDKP